ncbi:MULTISPECIES: extracellular catalytic domain type 2 short-chain-length polyhydroxyalkanoate depolymerase [Burkholderia]|uniref:extracellular catalytic domain type 2 short-chain-length polyhydroxyalkanoate depolymerase n=1 Tax=Burkholderia TaxID=32008 RepID=UPI00075671E1|nr:MULTISPECIES: PHB depolymerase family esterase [Burkholderia]AOJ68804.1 depolymerase [Burkholderia savannae]AOK47017.1 depolymerase [Burkholderia sp. MSMB617WGS]KVG45673.1 depolymerase [Burkholderia sp. MSMB0265]KVG87647.1 depolymerase [Burkholderia sp. MSMB2040]KVG99059.1 depolymerase [Burkholderia sp. MSMB2042]
MQMRHAAARAILAAALTIALAAVSASAQASPPLPALRADPNQVSVSGLSSGAYMAVQYQVAYSASVIGAGVIAGGPYYCAAGSLTNTGICMGLLPNTVPDSGLLLTAALGFAASGQIDPLANLQRAKIYLFSGTKDTIVREPAVDATWSFFWLAGVPVTNIVYVADIPAGHAFITPSAGNACDANAAPYISHCRVGQSGYDQAGALLETIYGPLAPPVAQPTGRAITFDQREFAPASSGLAADGYAYVPSACGASAGCKVHVVFHGCLQSADVVRDMTTYRDWADANNIVVLYPQVAKAGTPGNPQGCWDWFAYTGQNYALKSGAQMRAVRAMIDRVTSAR